MVWTADGDPIADHDMKSVDYGGELRVEVKSTTGREGRFARRGSEFRLAGRARRRYVLYRAYETSTATPSWRRIRDPIGLFDSGGSSSTPPGSPATSARWTRLKGPRLRVTASRKTSCQVRVDHERSGGCQPGA